MSRPKKTRGRKARSTSLTIAVVGEGVTPKDVGLRQLASILEATATAFESIAQDRDIEPPRLSLTKVKNGSAAYELASADGQAERAVGSFVATVRQRGRQSSARTRGALLRLHSAAAKAGAGLRIVPPDAAPGARPIMLAPPAEPDATIIEEATVVYARVVGLLLDVRDRGTVALRYDDGGRGDFQAEPEMVEAAARLIGRHVAARVTFLRGPEAERDTDGVVEAIEERAAPGDLLDAVTVARRQLEEHGLVVDAKAWLAEDRDE